MSQNNSKIFIVSKKATVTNANNTIKIAKKWDISNLGNNTIKTDFIATPILLGLFDTKKYLSHKLQKLKDAKDINELTKSDTEFNIGLHLNHITCNFHNSNSLTELKSNIDEYFNSIKPLLDME